MLKLILEPVLTGIVIVGVFEIMMRICFMIYKVEKE